VPLLTPSACLPLMLRLGLISTSAVVRGEVTIEDTSSRNSNRRVSRPRGAHYFLKQSVGTGHDATVEREALAYSYLSKVPGLARHLPRFYAYEFSERVLILEHVRGMHNLAEHYASGRCVTVATARSVGGILGTLHTLHADTLPGKLALPTEAPWILSVHRPSLRTLREISSANLELIREVQAVPALCNLLDELRAEWVCRTLIHMDLRWSNWLVPNPESSPGTSGIKLVDWETACLGDQRWDIGCTLGDYLFWWALRVPGAGGDESEGSDATEAALERVQRGVRAFWTQYCRIAQIEKAERSRFLLVSLRYAAARLIQSAYERHQSALKLDRFGVSLLQLSLNILKHPEAAAHRLCGFAPAVLRREGCTI
jgi:aminoglycoside phosphotransferase (APT) family kinase protein